MTADQTRFVCSLHPWKHFSCRHKTVRGGGSFRLPSSVQVVAAAAAVADALKLPVVAAFVSEALFAFEPPLASCVPHPPAVNAFLPQVALQPPPLPVPILQPPPSNGVKQNKYAFVMRLK